MKIEEEFESYDPDIKSIYDELDKEFPGIRKNRDIQMLKTLDELESEKTRIKNALEKLSYTRREKLDKNNREGILKILREGWE